MTLDIPLRRTLLLGLAAGVLVLAVACGGDSSDDGSSAPLSGASDGGAGGNDQVLTSGVDEGESAGRQGAPAAAGTADAGTGAPGALPSTIGRKQILIATLEIETDDVSQRFEDAGSIAAQHGGFVASSTFGNRGEAPTASLTIRIPAENYQRAIVDLRRLGEVQGVDQGGSDVTEEFTDLESRLLGLRAVEAQYLEFLARAVTIDEVLTVQDRINGVRVEVEQVQGRLNLISNEADLATITVHLAPPVIATEETNAEEGTTSPLEAMVNGWDASIVVLTGAATVVLAVLAFSWWLIPIAVVTAYFWRRQMRNSKRPPPPALPPTTAAT